MVERFNLLSTFGEPGHDIIDFAAHFSSVFLAGNHRDGQFACAEEVSEVSGAVSVIVGFRIK